MKKGSLADFLFVGLAVLPAALAFGGLPQFALLVFFPLLVAACCCGMDEQVRDEERRKPGGPGEKRKPGSPAGPGGKPGPRS